MFNDLLKNMTMNVDEHLDEEIHRVMMSGWFQIAKTSVLMELGCVILLVNWR